MGFEPQKFFIGLIDFFAVWVPGALLTFIATQLVPIALTWPPADVAGWIAFLLVSYLVGHFVFVLGSLLDRPFYDYLRHGTPRRQIERLASGGRTSPRLVRKLGLLMFAKFDEALFQAMRLRDEALGSLGATGAINAFQWCKAKLALEHRDALADVERLEADSKLFRSLAVIVVIVVVAQIAWLASHLLAGWIQTGPVDWQRSIGAFVLEPVILSFALWRYVERRTKATTQAYWLVLTANPTSPSPTPAAPDAPTHAGGVVLGHIDGEIRYLRVRERGPSPRWVLPKGHIESGEKPERTAVREVLEEAAIWARIEAPLATIELAGETERTKVKFFLMEFLDTASKHKSRRTNWMTPLEASNDDPRVTGWKPLYETGDLLPESREIVDAVAARLSCTEAGA